MRQRPRRPVRRHGHHERECGGSGRENAHRAKRTEAGGDSAGTEVRARERALGVLDERTAALDKPVRQLARPLEQRAVLPQAREPQVTQSRLARAQELTATPELEVALRELEAVRRRDERLEP